jgi:pyruvate,water dikinase
LTELADDELVTILERCTHALLGTHGYELLAALLPEKGDTSSLAAVALAAATRARNEGITDDDLAAAYPETLALTAPAIGGAPHRVPYPAAAGGTSDERERALSMREALRLRVRWIHELSARAAFELGVRLVRRGMLTRPDHVRHLSPDQLRRAITTRGAIEFRVDSTDDASELPAAFRLGADGSVVALDAGRVVHRRRIDARTRRAATFRGLPASGGRAQGVAWHGDGPRPAAAVLVVRTLDPQLASVLPDCVALVAETGNVLSHLAILAREFRIPAVVACSHSVESLPAGTSLVVDGDRGRVIVVDAAPSQTPAGAHT